MQARIVLELVRNQTQTAVIGAWVSHEGAKIALAAAEGSGARRPSGARRGAGRHRAASARPSTCSTPSRISPPPARG